MQDALAQDAPTVKTRSESETSEFMHLARERFELAQTAEFEFRSLSLDDLRFSTGEQWDETIRKQRAADGRPCLTTNRLPQFIRQVTNEQRQNKPAIVISPVDDGADKETAEVFQGLIRHIEQNSSAQTAYGTATDYQVRCGLGYLEVTTDYCEPESFDQEVKVVTVVDPAKVYYDPTIQQPDGSDANFAFYTEDWLIDEFRKKYDDSAAAGLPDFGSINDHAPGWATSETVRIAKYWTVEVERKKIVQIGDGSVHFEDKMPEGATVLQSRTTEIRKVRWHLINGIEILEEGEWAGQWIPLIRVPGEELVIDGKKHLAGLVRAAKDPQRMLNYWRSKMTEAIALSPTAPYVIAEGQIEGYEDLYKNANVKNYAYLPYKPKTLGNELVPPPQRQSVEPPIQAIAVATRDAIDDMNATTGIYPAAVGARSNETSGTAIRARQRESDVSNFHFSDNLARAMEFLGRILVDLIPKVYDTARVVRIIGADNQDKTVKINEPTVADGVNRIYELGAGRYDVRVQTGPSFASKRQEAASELLDLAKADATLMPKAGDLIFRTLDIPYADQFAKRLEKFLPPGIKEQEDDQNPQPIPPEVQQQLQALNQQHEQLTQALHQAMEIIDRKKLELDHETEMKKLDADVKLAVAEIQAKSKVDANELSAWMQRVDHTVNLLMQSNDHQHEAAMGAADHHVTQMQAEQQMEQQSPEVSGQPDIP